jgi:hypothetical protein
MLRKNVALLAVIFAAACGAKAGDYAGSYTGTGKDVQTATSGNTVERGGDARLEVTSDQDTSIQFDAFRLMDLREERGACVLGLTMDPTDDTRFSLADKTCAQQGTTASMRFKSVEVKFSGNTVKVTLPYVLTDSAQSTTEEGQFLFDGTR